MCTDSIVHTVVQAVVYTGLYRQFGTVRRIIKDTYSGSEWWENPVHQHIPTVGGNHDALAPRALHVRHATQGYHASREDTHGPLLTQ